MARRLPSPPPVLPGFSTIHVLGSGGFADVFLYEQNMPRRQVAVKVMLSEVVNDQVRQMFQAEANLMAQLSSHPSILTVYQASVSSDGRPYLVMELCSSALSERYRRERIPVPEVLRIAVKIGSAIETAHRAGVLHRDIKPSNILLTAYGHPVLSDFGIASTLSEADTHESVGLSIPWSAPEVLMDETPGSIASEVWSFAATVYSLLAGRSPFEVPGESNKSTDLISRINRARPQPIGRSDVPPSLERVLAQAMARKPENRPASVLELVRELQAIETELGVPQTPIEVAMDDWALATVSDLEDRTRIRGVGGVVPSARGRRRRRSASTTYAPVGTMMRQTGGAQNSRQKGVAQSSGTRPVERARGMRVLAWGLIVSAVLVIALGATATFVLIRANSDSIPQVTNIAAKAGTDSIKFSWTDPGLKTDDSYQVTTSDGRSSLQTSSDYFAQDAKAGDRVCITVAVNRQGKTGPPSAEKCVDFGR
ncbi:serine/threonine-protein kinase [Frigoribacterium sp. UYMn621]|jgi:serine/threonine protein kinase|uniref:serine/threonine-protein kinase n=1 Tax=Frigoribacterium sp. UYMn621 TaxID=3156343 RepID=UPI0033984979